MASVTVTPSENQHLILKYLNDHIKNPFLKRTLIGGGPDFIIIEPFFTYKEFQFNISFNNYEFKKNDDFFDKYMELTISAMTLESIELFIKECLTYNKLESELVVYAPCYCRWEKQSKLSLRSLDNVYLPEKVTQNLIKDLAFYQDSKTVNRYKELNINYSRIYMFYGPPGTGKTTLIKSIATQFKKNVAHLVVSPQLCDTDIKELIHKIPKNSILAIEDIDSLITEGNNRTTLSGILNILDGNLTPEGLLIFITTNHFNELDYTIKRRISYFIEFGYATKEQIEKIYTNFFPMGCFESFYSKIKHLKTSINIIEKFFVKYLFEDINNYIDEFITFATGEIKISGDLSMYS
uniref:AAA+ ATPase domain-containing protein n=1 Tax=viral metagenome TaxID=1070528 RepID=A0A6C0I903_9ZZZZ